MVVVILCIVITSLASVFIINTINNNEREREEMRVRRREMSEQLFYAYDMFFQSVVASENLHITALTVATGEVELSDVVFVHSEAESGGFPDDVVVAWPSEDTVLFLEFLNDWGMVLTVLEAHNITLPLTLEDLVDNWEMIREAWMSSDRTHSARVHFLDRRRRNADSE